MLRELKHLLHIFARSASHEWHYLGRHRWDRIMLIWAPLVTILLMWWIFSAGQITKLPIGVWDQDNSAPSRQLVRYLNSAPGVQVTEQYTDSLSAERALDSVHVYGVVIIPQDFAPNLKTGSTSPVALQFNAQFGTHSGIVQRAVQSVVATFSAGVEIRARNNRGQAYEQAKDTQTTVRTAAVTLFNLSSNYQKAFAATMIPALLHILGMVAGAYAIGREIRDHDLGNWLKFSTADTHPDVAPNFWEIAFALNGKLLWAMLSFTIWAGLTLLFVAGTTEAVIWSWLATFLGLWLMMLVSLWMGVIASAGSLSLRMGLSLTGFITAPAFAFSGVAFPLLAMSAGARIWANILPLTHYLHLQINQLEMNAPAWWAISTLLGFICAVIILLLISTGLTQRALRYPERWGAR